jgi:hypothetical protein
MVKSWRAWSFALAVLAGCTVERAGGEFGASACADGDDNDSDGKTDCGDPDCQAEAICGRGAPLREPDDDPEPTPSGAPAPAPMPRDASAPRPTPMNMADAEVTEPVPMPEPALPDASTPEPTRMCPVCAIDESCIEGYCVPNEAVFVELWDVTSISVVMPRGIDAFSCLDDFCLLAEMSDGPTGFRTCRCQPDPFVRIQVIRPGEQPEGVVTTAYKKDEDAWTWDERRQLRLRPDYQLNVQALDRDGVTSNPVVFECMFPADPDLLGSGLLECAQRFDGVGASFEASLRVAIEPAAGAPAMP